LNSNKTAFDFVCHLQNAVNLNGTIYCYDSHTCYVNCITEGEWKWSTFSGENWSTCNQLFKYNGDLYATGNDVYKFQKNGRYEKVCGNLGINGVPCGVGDFLYYTIASPTQLIKRNMKTEQVHIIETDPHWGRGIFLTLNGKVYIIQSKIYELDPTTDKYQVCSKRSGLNCKSACVFGNKIALLLKTAFDDNYIIQTHIELFDPETGDLKELTGKEEHKKPIINHYNQGTGHCDACNTICEWTN